MSRYSVEDRVWMVKNWFKSDENAAVFLRRWRSSFKNRPPPSEKTVKTLINKFEHLGIVTDDEEGMKTKEKTARTPENIEKARETMRSEPSTSMEQLGQQLQVSKSSAWRIARKDLKNFPYKVSCGQPLSAGAIAKRYEFACELDALINDGSIDPRNIIFSDEAHFWLNGYVNRQNYRIWGTEKPEMVVVRPLHPKKLTVWAALCADGVIGPFFFEETVNAERYATMIKDQFIPEAISHNWIENCWFQQDGAPPHTTYDNLELLKNHYGGRVIARSFPETFQCGLAWPPYSPDLSPLDFFLWGYTKDKVFRTNPKTLDELRNAIVGIIESIPDDMFENVIASFQERLQYCISQQGSHFENVLH